MDSRYTYSGIGEIGDRTSFAGPHKPRVFANLNIRKLVTTPETLAVSERVAGDPRSFRRWIAILPCLIACRIEVRYATAAANIGAVIEHRPHLRAHAPRRVPVIIVPVHDKLATSLFTREVALGPDRQLLIETHITNAIVRRH